MLKKRPSSWRRAAVLALGCGIWFAVRAVVPDAAQADEAAVQRGAYIFAAADCVGCHTDAKNKGKRLAGGRALSTPFGTFYSPNITPDKETGIGAWSLADFTRALRRGISPDGAYYFPVFPYPSFTGMSDGDIADLYAYLMAQPPVAQADRRHDISFFVRWRFLQLGWRTLFFDRGPLAPEPDKDAAWNRGRYLVDAVAHCGECHTARNFLGATKPSRLLAGNRDGPDGLKVPNITSDADTGIGKWSVEDITTLLKSGQTPNFDFVGAGMSEVVEGMKGLSDDDLKAIAAYLRAVPPIVTPKPKE